MQVSAQGFVNIARRFLWTRPLKRRAREWSDGLNVLELRLLSERRGIDATCVPERLRDGAAVLQGSSTQGLSSILSLAYHHPSCHVSYYTHSSTRPCATVPYTHCALKFCLLSEPQVNDRMESLRAVFTNFRQCLHAITTDTMAGSWSDPILACGASRPRLRVACKRVAIAPTVRNIFDEAAGSSTSYE